MNVPELIQIIDPQDVMEFLAVMKAYNLTPYKWRISSAGKNSDGLFILRTKTHRGEAIVGGFPSISDTQNFGWLASHVILWVVFEKVSTFSLTKPTD